ncbi:spore cortex biosynthesis protein YabQ [Clostridium carnis]
MPLTIGIQIDIIIYAILAGLLVGVLFDLYRIIRGAKIPKFIVIIEDILFWILAALVIFIFLLYTNYAFLGLYVYIFMIAALFIYLKLISPVVFKIEKHIVSGATKFFRVIAKNIIYPFKVIYYNISGKNNSKSKNIKK